MSNYRPGSRISQVWAVYETQGADAATRFATTITPSLAKITINKWVSGWEREKRKGGSVQQTTTPYIKAAKLSPDKKMTKERLLLALMESKSRGASSLYCARWLVEAEQLVKLGYVVEHSAFKNAFSITNAGLKQMGKRK